MENTSITPYQFTLESAIQEWLEQKKNHTNSERTKTAYQDTINAFRAFLSQGNLDLLDNPNDIARITTLWANMRTASTRKPGQAVSPSTYNQRLAILSSFYAFLNENYKPSTPFPNPIESVPKRPVQAYAAALPLDENEALTGLESINRRSKEGLRDYALIAVALYTGRRANELVSLRWEHIKITGSKGQQRVTLTFHCKGNKIKRDMLDVETSAVLLEYLHAQHGKNIMSLPGDTPLWISYSRRNYGQAIGHDTLRNICTTYLNTGKSHTLRHTFAVGMMHSGAPITELADRLGHTDIKITQTYAKELRGADNPYGERLTSRFGIHRKAGK